jgi:hypothetical protein
MNIVWQMPGGEIAITSIFDESDPVAHAEELQNRGDIPAEWISVATDYQGLIPDDQQESWRWADGSIVVDQHILTQLKMPKSISAWQIRKALNQLNLRNDVETAIASGSQDLKDAWQFASSFDYGNPLINELAIALGKDQADIDQLFMLAATL